MRAREGNGGRRGSAWSARAIVVFLVLGPLAPGTAAAQPRNKDLWAFAGAGYGRALNHGMPSGSVGFAAGFFHRLRSTPNLALGGEIGWHSLGSAMRATTLPDYGRWGRDYSITMVPVSLELFYAPPARAGRPSPMLTGGLGLYAIRTEWENRRPPPGVIVPRKEVKSESKPGANAGVGITFASRSLALRAGVDVRYHFVAAEGRSLGILIIAGRAYL